MKDFLIKNWLGLVAIVISVGTWLSFWLRFSPFTWDSFSVMATTMGVIVTFLVGFQISALIGLREFKNKMEDEQKKLDEKVKILDLRQKDSHFTYSYYFAKLYGMSLNLPEYTSYSLQAMYYALLCNTEQHIINCNELIRGVNDIIKTAQGLSITGSRQELLLRDFYRVKAISQVEGVDNKALEEIGKHIIKASIIPE